MTDWVWSGRVYHTLHSVHRRSLKHRYTLVLPVIIKTPNNSVSYQPITTDYPSIPLQHTTEYCHFSFFSLVLLLSIGGPTSRGLPLHPLLCIPILNIPPSLSLLLLFRLPLLSSPLNSPFFSKRLISLVCFYISSFCVTLIYPAYHSSFLLLHISYPLLSPLSFISHIIQNGPIVRIR